MAAVADPPWETGTWADTVWAANVWGVLSVTFTPDVDRTFTVAYDDRSFVVDHDDRTFTVAADRRRESRHAIHRHGH